RDEVIQHRNLSLLRRVDGLSSDRVVDSIAISELQPRMTTVEERVQTPVEDGEIAATMSKQVQILKTALQEVRAENQDLRTRLSASESSERCMITCLLKIEDRISALELCSPMYLSYFVNTAAYVKIYVM
ncbi:hypothetical protein Tco_0263863, partial [Tanacetum coccineum]